MDQDHYAGQRNGSLTLSSPVPPPAGPNEQAAPAFSFIASLYLDGRRTPERKIIVYTDPNDKDFKSPDGKVLFKHRWVQSKNGRMTEHAWVFKEKAIETVFDRLIINGAQGDVEGQDEDAMAKAMESSCLATQETLGNDRSSVGQIIVEIQRVRLGKKRREENYRSKHTEGGDEGIDMDKVAKDITHATGFVHKNTLSSASLRVVDYWPYQPGEGPFATFKFFYRSLG